MGLLAWLKSRFQMAPVNRVAAVECGDESLTLRWARGASVSLDWHDVERVMIQTTDGGPFDDDVFWILQAAGKSYVIPQTSVGTDLLLKRLQQLPGFRNESVIASMGCTDNQQFLCWERTSNR